MAFPQRFSYPETQEKALTVNHQNEAYLLIDSNDRYPLEDGAYITNSPQPNNNYVINHQKLNGFGQLTKIAVTEYQFPWITPNVNIRNNVFAIVDNNLQEIYVVVPEYWYLPADLATALQTALNGTQYLDYPSNTPNPTPYGGTTWVVTANTTTGAFTVSNSNTAVVWAPSAVDGPVLNEVMNFPTVSNPTLSRLTNSWTGGIPSMAYTTYIDVCSNTLTKFQTVKDSLTQFNYSNIITRIYLNDGMNQQNSYFGSRPSVIYRQVQDPKWMRWNIDQMIGQIDIQYYDDSGELLYIPENNEYTNSYPDSNTAQIFTVKMSES
jgi:hypothetical protein